MNVFIIASLTVDGYIGERTTQSSLTWTSKEDLQFFVKRTKQAGIVVMGDTTFKTIGKPLKDRRMIIYTHNPDTLDIEGIETTIETPQDLVKRLTDEGSKEVAVCGGSTIYKLFMDSGVVDELYLSIEPVAFGQGIPLFNGPVSASFKLLDATNLNEYTLLLHYSVNK